MFAHHIRRGPAVATGPAEVRNNVVYNFQQAFVHHNPAEGQFNIIGNYFKRGPSAALSPFLFDDEEPGTGAPQYFLKDNMIDDAPTFDACSNAASTRKRSARAASGGGVRVALSAASCQSSRGVRGARSGPSAPGRGRPPPQKARGSW